MSAIGIQTVNVVKGALTQWDVSAFAATGRFYAVGFGPVHAGPSAVVCFLVAGRAV